MASTIITKNKNTGTPSSLAAGELAINTTEGSLYYGSTGGTSVSSSFKFGMVTASVVSASGNVEGGSLRADDLTAGRVAFVGTDGLLVDDSDLTFTTATLYSTNIESTTVEASNLEVGNIKAKDGTAAGSIADSSGIVTLASSVLTTTDINGGTIDGCDITVGSGKTLELRNASAVNLGDINAANISIGDDIVHAGDLNNLISFDTDTQDFQTGGSSRLDISDSGIRLGGTGARVTSITDDDSLGTSDTVLCTQGNVKAYVDANAGFSGNKFATDLKVGRDADNLIDFTTDNQVTFRVSAGDGIIMKASGEIEATKFDGALEGNADTATSAATLTTPRAIFGHNFDGSAALTGVIASANLDADTAHLTTTQTFTGVKTFNEAINKKALHFLYTTNKFTLDTSNELYFSLSDADRDTGVGSEDQVGVMAIVPLTGILKHVIINSSSVLSGKTWEFRLYRVPSSADADSGGKIKIATVAASAGPAAHTNKVISFVTDPGDGTNDISYETGYNATTMFTAGDRIILSLESNTDVSGNPKINSVLCFELDESTI